MTQLMRQATAELVFQHARGCGDDRKRAVLTLVLARGPENAGEDVDDATVREVRRPVTGKTSVATEISDARCRFVRQTGAYRHCEAKGGEREDGDVLEWQIDDCNKLAGGGEEGSAPSVDHACRRHLGLEPHAGQAPLVRCTQARRRKTGSGAWE
jgi:hypothetical protein